MNLHLEGRVVLLVGGVVAAECVRRLVVEVLDRVVVSYRVGDLAAGGPSLRHHLFTGEADAVGRDACHDFGERIDSAALIASCELSSYLGAFVGHVQFRIIPG